MIKKKPIRNYLVCEHCKKEVEKGTFVRYEDHGNDNWCCIECWKKIDRDKVQFMENFLSKKKDYGVLVYQLLAKNKRLNKWEFTHAKFITSEEFRVRREREQWCGSAECDCCGNPFVYKMFDVKTKCGAWANLCPICNEIEAKVILEKSVLGVGQVYEKYQDEKGNTAFLKI